MEDKYLFHGSRDGISPPIEPKSRSNCDFGRGFYMGETKEQARTFVCEQNAPKIYTLRFRLSEIPENKILKLEDDEWLYAVLAKRGYCKEFNKLKIAKEWSKKLEKYDVIIGKIADDKMKDSIVRFAENEITDATLKACLLSVNHGLQYVAKTELACSKIDILEEKQLFGLELKNAREQAAQRRIDGVKSVNQAIKLTRGEGKFLQELMDEQSEIEKRFRIKGKVNRNDNN